MERFTVEEINLICIYVAGSSALESWAEVIREIRTAIKYLEDGELWELSERVAGKLEAMTDKEFAGLDFVVAE